VLIDWFTVGAQALNFLVLVWLMKRFLYKPILQAIDTREKKISAELAAAASQKAEAEKERAELQRKTASLDDRRATLMKEATDAAAAERARLLAAARQAADALAAKRQEALRADAKSLGQAIRRRTQEEVFAIARKALGDLATTSLEERLGEVFTRRLREMGAQDKARLAKALKGNAEPALVRSAFDLPEKERATIGNAVNETFSADIRLRFETAPGLVCGIELATTGMKVGWTIEDYLTSVEHSVEELLNKKAELEPAKTEPAKTEPAKTEPAKTEPTKTEVKEPEANTKAKPEAKPEPTATEAAKP
jgi:F-type H+-transporting ATPase subunit b